MRVDTENIGIEETERNPNCLYDSLGTHYENRYLKELKMKPVVNEQTNSPRSYRVIATPISFLIKYNFIDI